MWKGNKFFVKKNACGKLQWRTAGVIARHSLSKCDILVCSLLLAVL